MRDHPCVCGEKIFSSIAFVMIPGSPLRMRGKAFTCIEDAAGNRITPAYAGKRLRRTHKEDAHGDHPCVCGEKLK